MKKIISFLVLMLAIPFINADAAVKVVASTSDLAYMARQVGGDLVSVTNIASPKSDLHYVEVRPSYMVKVNKADVVLRVGLELDLWMDRIIDGARNDRIQVVDCSRHVQPLEIPTTVPDARQGDLHRFGNPHYWMSPHNLEPITRAIVEGLSAVDPTHADQYEAQRQAFLEDTRAGVLEWAGSLEGVELVFYHNSWPYFNDFVGATAAGFVEPFPGVPPSPSHVAQMIHLIRERGIKVIAIEPYFDSRVPNKIADESGARVITLHPSVGGRDSDESYLEWLSGNVEALREALQ